VFLEAQKAFPQREATPPSLLFPDTWHILLFITKTSCCISFHAKEKRSALVPTISLFAGLQERLNEIALRKCVTSLEVKDAFWGYLVGLKVLFTVLWEKLAYSIESSNLTFSQLPHCLQNVFSNELKGTEALTVGHHRKFRLTKYVKHHISEVLSKLFALRRTLIKRFVLSKKQCMPFVCVFETCTNS